MNSLQRPTIQLRFFLRNNLLVVSFETFENFCKPFLIPISFYHQIATVGYQQPPVGIFYQLSAYTDVVSAPAPLLQGIIDPLLFQASVQRIVDAAKQGRRRLLFLMLGNALFFVVIVTLFTFGMAQGWPLEAMLPMFFGGEFIAIFFMVFSLVKHQRDTK